MLAIRLTIISNTSTNINVNESNNSPIRNASQHNHRHHYHPASSLTNVEYFSTTSQFHPAPVEPCFDRIWVALHKAFSGRVHLMSRSRCHIGFVAEVITAVMETAIFAYLGLFLFSDSIGISN
jgi:hypothetical protein